MVEVVMLDVVESFVVPVLVLLVVLVVVLEVGWGRRYKSGYCWIMLGRELFY